MPKPKSTEKKKPGASIAPGSNWLALKKKLPTTSKGSLISRQPAKTQPSPSSASFPRGSVPTNPIPDVVTGSSKIFSEEVKSLQDLVLGKGVAGEDLVGEPGRYIAIDCEMVGVGENGSESSLARASIVDFQGRVVLDEFVLQRERVTDYRTQVSGVRPKDMINAKPFSEVQARIATLLSSADRILVGHALHNDLTALLLSHPAARIRDTQVYAGRKPNPGKGKGKGKEGEGEKTLWEKYRSPRIGLKRLVKEELGLDIQAGEHSSVLRAVLGRSAVTGFSIQALWRTRSLNALSPDDATPLELIPTLFLFFLIKSIPKWILLIWYPPQVTDARAAMAIYRLHKRAWDASLPVSYVKRGRTTSGNEAESGSLATGEDMDQAQEGSAKRKRRDSAGEFPGGGRKGVSSGLGTIIKPRARKTGKERVERGSADQAGLCLELLVPNEARNFDELPGGEDDKRQRTELKAFVPPARRPSGPRPLPTLAPSRNTSYSSTYRPIIVESPLAQSREDLSSPPPSSFDPSKLGYQDAIKKTPGTSEDSFPLLRPPTPKRRASLATQLPTVPITPNVVPDIPWTISFGGFMSHFEPTPVWPLVIHTALCVAAFPIVYWLCTAASGLALFWARAIVGAVTGVVGFTIGYNLIRLSRRGIDATAVPRYRLIGLILPMGDCYPRIHAPRWGCYTRTVERFRCESDKPLVCHTALIPPNIQTQGHKEDSQAQLRARFSTSPIFRTTDDLEKQRQLDRYVETMVAGDLSTEDVQRADALSKAAYSNFNFTWSLIPFSSVGLLPMGRTFQIPRTEHIPHAAHNVTDTIHIAETYADQLLPSGVGFGTFDEEGTDLVGRLREGRDSGRDATGGIVRWPKWGIRVGCQVLEGLDRYLTPVSEVNNMTYLYVPKTALYSLFQSMDIAYPQIPPVNLSALLEPGDPMPQGIVEAEIAVTSKWWQNGVAHSFKSAPFSNGSQGTGWLQLEIVLTRLHEDYAPNSSFGAYATPDVLWPSGRVGYDVAICVEEIRSWVVEAYNSTAGNPTTLRILHKGMDLNAPVYTRQNTTTSEDGTQSGISSAGKFAAFGAAHDNSRNVMLKDNGRDFAYVPNPTTAPATRVHKTGRGKGSECDCQIGCSASAKLMQNYSDVAPGIHSRYFCTSFTSRTPRRDFGVYSWLAAIEGDAIVGIPTGVGRYEHLEELQRRGGEVKVRYMAPNENDWKLPVEERAHKEFFERYYAART
ncbi:hypothetical protein RHS01_09824 [Rhizoctonia solani]|uniref:RNA exonuclease 4 n=1 Tax=Rhizoctonia solani TaxID=456999 RepID=A0A8H7I4M8_9AGAM|nr:hypothetical protein RHS01_09824 [Rhizoctonia solani]